MLDIKFIRENSSLIEEASRKKKIKFNVQELLASDDKRVALLSEVEEKRARQNRMNNDIAQATGATREDLINEMRILKDGLQKKEEELKETLKEWQRLMVSVPNIPDISVPEGESDADNIEIRKWGETPNFSFVPKSHIELFEKLDLADTERGAKVAGFRGYYLKNDLALLSLAIWNLALDEMTAKGFTPIIAPSLIRREAFLGTGYLPQGEEDLYKTQDESYLSGTGEVPMMGYFMNEVIEREKLPLKFVVFSPCYRREAGAHGKDTKGLLRVHEFYKVEQVVFCEASHEESVRYHEELTKNGEAIMQALEIPYRVVANCGADLGLGQVKKYDIEAWVPSEGKYRETHSASYFHDFQTRRLNIKYRDESGKLRFAHSLNDTTIATPRVLVPLLENNQDEVGAIHIPVALQKYLRKEKIGV